MNRTKLTWLKKSRNASRNARRLGAKNSKVAQLVIKTMFMPRKILDIGFGMEIVSGIVTTQTLFQVKHDQLLLQLNHGQLLFQLIHPKNARMVDRLMAEFRQYSTE